MKPTQTRQYNFHLECGLYLMSDLGDISPNALILRDMDHRDWHDEFHHKPQCNKYRLFKTDFVFEKYILLSEHFYWNLEFHFNIFPAESELKPAIFSSESCYYNLPCLHDK